MYWLDQILVKLYTTGHRVLLFSTMTRMLDTVEFYLNWRKVRNKHVCALPHMLLLVWFCPAGS
jgi:SNF2 family DNA or RNA helicase